MPEHIKTPWKRSRNGGIILSQNGNVLASIMGMRPESDANAQFIVKAVNNHDKLVEALEAIIHEGTRAINECKNSNVKAEYDIDKVDRIARQALKEAEG